MAEDQSVRVRIGEDVGATILCFEPEFTGAEITTHIRRQLGFAGGRLVGKRNVEILDSRVVPPGQYVFIEARISPVDDRVVEQVLERLLVQDGKRQRSNDDVGNWSVKKISVPGPSNQTNITEIGTIWVVKSVIDIKVFVRDASVKLWEQLESLKDFNSLIIGGAPGVGKSTELAGWVQFKRRSKNILYVSYTGSTGHDVMFCTPNGTERYHVRDFTLEDSQLRELDELLYYLRGIHQIDVFVCDGYREKHGMLTGSLIAFQHSIVIFCSSYKAGAQLKGQERQNLVNERQLYSFDMDSWTYQEYLDAFRLKTFQGTINSISALRERYYYGGGSVRCMLMSKETCTQNLLEAISRCSDTNALFEGLVGRSSCVGVNSLFQTIKGITSPVSGYVSDKLMDIHGCSFIKRAREYLNLNHAFQGWVFELEVLLYLKCNISAVAKKPLIFPADNLWNQILHYEPLITLKHLDPFSIREMTLFVPTKFNHELFDFMIFVSRGHIVVGNATVAGEHSFKMSSVQKYLEFFKDKSGKCRLDFHVIIPLYNLESYKLQKRHFTCYKQLYNYDRKWAPGMVPSEICRVLAFDRDKIIEAGTHPSKYTYKFE